MEIWGYSIPLPATPIQEFLGQPKLKGCDRDPSTD